MLARRVFLFLLLVLTVGCRAGEPAAASPVPGEPPFAANAVASAAPVSSPVPAENAPGTLCAAQEAALFSCTLTSGGKASLCASRDAAAGSGHVYYAYGSTANLELLFPATRQPPSEFRRTHMTFAGSTGGYAYSFENRGYRYILYSVSGASGLQDQGLLVTRGDPRRAISGSACKPGSVVEDESPELLDPILEWDPDPDLEQHGLPRRE